MPFIFFSFFLLYPKTKRTLRERRFSTAFFAIKRLYPNKGSDEKTKERRGRGREKGGEAREEEEEGEGYLSFFIFNIIYEISGLSL